MVNFVQNHIPKKVLKILNQCRVCLQGIFISDIMDAARTIVLNSIKHGWMAGTRKSNLNWPAQPRPPSSAWSQWRTAIAHLEENEWPSSTAFWRVACTIAPTVGLLLSCCYQDSLPVARCAMVHHTASTLSLYSPNKIFIQQHLLHRTHNESLPMAACPTMAIQLAGQSGRFMVSYPDTPMHLA